MLFQKLYVGLVLLIYWGLSHFQTVMEMILDDYHMEIWDWGWYCWQYDKAVQPYRKRSGTWRKAIINRYIAVQKRVKYIKSASDVLTSLSSSTASSSPTMKKDRTFQIEFRPKDLDTHTQVFTIARQWRPIFMSSACDLQVIGRKPQLSLTIKMSYSTRNKSYEWGVLDTHQGLVLGTVKLQHGNNIETTAKFVLNNLAPDKRYRFRLVHYLGSDEGEVHLHLNKSAIATVHLSDDEPKTMMVDHNSSFNHPQLNVVG